MYYKRIKGKVFVAKKVFGECHAISFYNCMLSPNDNEAVISNILASAEFNTEIESRKGSCT